MRRILVLAAVAAAVSAVPAQAYLVNGCGYGDYTVAEVTLANRELVHVCTSDDPRSVLDSSICLPCIVK